MWVKVQFSKMNSYILDAYKLNLDQSWGFTLHKPVNTAKVSCTVGDRIYGFPLYITNDVPSTIKLLRLIQNHCDTEHLNKRGTNRIEFSGYLELKCNWLVDKVHFARDRAAIVTNDASVSQSHPGARVTSTATYNKMSLVYRT